jgi:hypothetical protein
MHGFKRNGCHNILSALFQHCDTCITQYPIPEIVDTPLTLIFRMGQGACRYYFSLGRCPIPWLWMVATDRRLAYPRCRAKNLWLSVVAHFQNGAVTVSYTLLPKKAASSLVMDSSDPVTFQLPYLQDLKSLTLRWRSFSECGREPDSIIFDTEGSQ